MSVHINLWAILLAAVSSLIIGAIYYSPGVCGKAWVRDGNIDEKLFQKTQPKLMPVFLVCALLAAYVVARFSFIYHSFYSDTWLGSAVATSMLLFLGIALTTVVVHGALDQRPRRLMYITLGNRLLSLLAMGLIIGWLHP